MTRKYFNPESISESPETLLRLMKEHKDSRAFHRLRTLYLLKTGQAESIIHVARILGCSKCTVRDWILRYREGGISRLFDGFKISSNYVWAEPNSGLREWLTPENYGIFTQWRDEQGLTDSLAINLLVQGLCNSTSEIEQKKEESFLNENFIPGKDVDVAPDGIPVSLTVGTLARRLQVSEDSLRRGKKRRTFLGWSRLKDPDGFGWKWNEVNKIFDRVIPIKMPSRFKL